MKRRNGPLRGASGSKARVIGMFNSIVHLFGISLGPIWGLDWMLCFWGAYKALVLDGYVLGLWAWVRAGLGRCVP